MSNPNAIRSIAVYAVELPFKALGSRWLGRDKPEYLDSTVVVIETVSGLTGIGERQLRAPACGRRTPAPRNRLVSRAEARGTRVAIVRCRPTHPGRRACWLSMDLGLLY